MSDQPIVIEGQKYFVRNGVVTKEHGQSEKVIVNKERISQVLGLHGVPEKKVEKVSNVVPIRKKKK